MKYAWKGGCSSFSSTFESENILENELVDRIKPNFHVGLQQVFSKQDVWLRADLLALVYGI